MNISAGKGRWIVIETDHDNHALYTEDLQARVEAVFRAAGNASELKKVFTHIKAEAERLRNLFFTDEEQNEIQDTLRNLDATIQKAHYCISKNLEAYQASKWAEIMDEEQGE